MGKNCYSYLCNPGLSAIAHRARAPCIIRSTFKPFVMGLQCQAEELKVKDHTVFKVVLLHQKEEKGIEASPRHLVLHIVPLSNP